MKIENTKLLREAILSSVQGTKIGGLSAAGHLKASWCEEDVFAGDSIAISMLRSTEYDQYRMWSWLANYKVFRISDKYAHQKAILQRISTNRRVWLSSSEPSPVLLETIYRTLIDGGIFNCFVLATKVAWLMRPIGVAIYDSKVATALEKLSNLGCVSGINLCPQNAANKRTADTTQRVVEYYAEFHSLMTDISDQCDLALDKVLKELELLFHLDGKVIPSELKDNKLRALDKILWMMGSAK